MPAGGSPQPMSVDPDGSTPAQVREAILQHPNTALRVSSPKSILNISINYHARRHGLKRTLTGFKDAAPQTVAEAIASNVDADQIQELYTTLKLVTAALVEVACTRDITLAPPWAAPTHPTPELSQ
ncbi:hypothetical protein H0H81_000607, partial [Sphagnurus paluster]